MRSLILSICLGLASAPAAATDAKPKVLPKATAAKPAAKADAAKVARKTAQSMAVSIYCDDTPFLYTLENGAPQKLSQHFKDRFGRIAYAGREIVVALDAEFPVMKLRLDEDFASEWVGQGEKSYRFQRVPDQEGVFIGRFTNKADPKRVFEIFCKNTLAD